MRILVVDDDEDLNRLLSRFLEANGFEVLSAGDALQALDAVGRHAVDLVITDLAMPVVDGAVFIEMLKADPLRKDLPIIVITAYQHDARAEKCLRKGAAFVLPKPFDFNRLLSIIRFAE